MEKIKFVKPVSSRVLANKPQKSLFFWSCDDFEGLSTGIDSNSPYFGLFIAADASKVSHEKIGAVAGILLGRGLAFLCAWGPDCEKVHDDFDSAAILADPECKRGVIMTTWHADEPLSEALWFFIHSAFPDESYEPTCLEWIVAGVGTDQWNETLRGELDKVLTQES